VRFLVLLRTFGEPLKEEPGGACFLLLVEGEEEGEEEVGGPFLGSGNYFQQLIDFTAAAAAAVRSRGR